VRRIAAKNGVVIASEKKVPSILVDAKSVEKISLITYTHRTSPHLTAPHRTALRFVAHSAAALSETKPVITSA
jgi:20S proteasome alpha/beta subunit